MRNRPRCTTGLITAGVMSLIALGSWTTVRAQEKDHTLEAMTEELDRSASRLVLDDYDAPYFASVPLLSA